MRTRLLTIAGISAMFANAQPTDAPAPLLADGYAAYGAFVTREQRVGLSEWHGLLPGSTLLQRDLSGLTGGLWDYGPWSNGYGTGRNGTGCSYLAIGLNPTRQTLDHGFEQRLRVGFGFLGEESLYGNWGRTLTGVYDTLVSQQTGQMTFLDSSWTEGYTASAYRSRIAADLSYLIRRVSTSRWSWQAGIGIQVGVALSGQVELTHYTRRYRDHSGNRYDSSEYTVLDQESLRFGSSLFVSTYALLGLDYRLGRTNPFWSQLHLFAEARPMMTLSSLPGSAARFEPASQHLFGVRIDLR